jgi:hypothetical protein
LEHVLAEGVPRWSGVFLLHRRQQVWAAWISVVLTPNM